MAQRMISRRWLAAVTLQALFAASAALVPTPRGQPATGRPRAGRAPLSPLSPLLRAASGGGGSGGGSSGKDGGEPTSPFDAAKLLEQAAEQAKGSIEQVVRATGNDQYKFGDFSKKALEDIIKTEELAEQAADELSKTTTSNIEEAVRKMTGDEGYKFGDLSKKAVAELISTEERVVRQATGDTKYQFGDITKKLIDESERGLADLQKDFFDVTPNNLWKKLFEGMSVTQREQAIFAMLQLSTVALLTFQFMSSLSTSLMVVASWSAVVGAGSPLASTESWRSFLAAYQTIKLAADPILLPFKAAATLVTVARYRNFVRALQMKLPLQSKPNLNRALALVSAFVCHTVALAGLTWVGVWGLTRFHGLPVFAR